MVTVRKIEYSLKPTDKIAYSNMPISIVIASVDNILVAILIT